MPVDLDDLQASIAQVKVSESPKFFSKNLTGSGKSAGLLNDRKRPGRYDGGGGPSNAPNNALRRKERISNGKVVTQIIPFGTMVDVLLTNAYDRGITFPVPSAEERFELTAGKSNLGFDAYLSLTPQGALLQEDSNGEKISRRLDIKYRMEVTVAPHGAKQDTSAMLLAREPHPTTALGAQPFVLVDWSYGPLDDVYDLVERATAQHTGTGRGVVIDDVDLAEWMDHYDLHAKISSQADEWSTDAIGEQVALFVEELFQLGTPGPDALNALAAQLLYMETYSVPLSAYVLVHKAIQAHVPDVEMRGELSNQNMNLLMNHVLDGLDALKPSLPRPPRPQGQAVQTKQVQQGGKTPPSFSAQQRNAIDTDEPLVLCQAGAGTGKSTVIIGRIDNLTARGVDPADITVLSFTNAAADNITERNPNVGSMTIAKMVHDIYQFNYPDHGLSTLETLLNSLEIYFGTDAYVEALQPRLLRVAQKKPGAMTELSNFVGYTLDRLLHCLSVMKQTCLELEVIVAYHLIETMQEPSNVKSRYLIIDEVQDNSIFEFVYLLKYVAKNKENLFIVGDSAQTLFEFRSANPKAINALESSGVFATYQLTTNYRSNQEILDFANVALDDIEANQFAKIRLQANSLDQPTEKSFTEAVTLDYRAYTKRASFTEELPNLIVNPASRLSQWIDERVQKGELVALLAYERSTVKAMQDALAERYPGKHIASLVSDKIYDSNAFSEYVKTHWNEVVVVGHHAAAATFGRQVIATLKTHGKNPAQIQGQERGVRSLIESWWLSNMGAINQDAKLVDSGALTSDQFYENLRDSILNHEIEHNSIRQRVVGQANKARKQADLEGTPDLIVSTIHGSKGLEFPHAVVVHKYDNAMDEQDKRLYYVAFTRAMKSEYIISHGLVKNAKIEKDHQGLIEVLRKRDATVELREQGVDVDSMPEDELEAALSVVFEARTKAAEELAAVELAASASAAAQAAPVAAGAAAPVDEVDDGTAFTA